MKCTPHYHFIDLPNGRRVRTNKDCNTNGEVEDYEDLEDFDEEELGTGWSVPGKEISRYPKGSKETYRVTTTHVAALRCLLKKKMKTKGGLSQQQGKEGLLKACTGFGVNLEKVMTDDYYAAVVWANLRNNKKLGVNIQRIAMMCLPSGLEKFAKKAGSALGDIAKVALPIAAVVFPVLAPVLAPLAVVANVAGKVKDVIDAGSKVKKAVDTVGDVKKQVESVAKPVISAVSSAGSTVKDIKKVASVATGTKPIIKAVPKAQIKAAVANVPSQITKDVIAGLQRASIKNKVAQQSTDKVAKEVASKVASTFTPEVNSILKMLKQNQLQQQATSEHIAINKQNERDKTQQAIKKQISSLDKKISQSIAQKKRAQVAASFFGVPTRLL